MFINTIFINKTLINKIIKCSMVTLVVLTSSSCSQKITVSSNLDPDNFREYFSASKVKIIHDESELTKPYKFIGLVEGQSCQEKAHHELPDEITARTETRKNAYKIHADAVLFTACTLISDNEADKQCVATRVCYAKAFITQEHK